MTEPGPLFQRVVSALRAVALSPTDVDTDLENVTFAGDGQDTVGVVMPHFRATVFYSVWPDQVPTDALARAAEFVVRANTNLYTSALELDVDKQILSARSAVDCSAIDALGDEAFGALLRAALHEAQRVATGYRAAVAAVMFGASALEGLSKVSG